jgi:hypothetical protein
MLVVDQQQRLARISLLETDAARVPWLRTIGNNPPGTPIM